MKDEKFKQILVEKESFQLGEDFDKKMMLMIKSHSKKREAKSKEIILMYLFFFLVFTFGLVLVNQYVDLCSYTLSNKLGIKNLVLVPYIFIILFLFEKVFEATLVSFRKEKFFFN